MTLHLRLDDELPARPRSAWARALLALHDRLCRALDAVSRQELGWVGEQAQRLIGELVRMDSNLEALRRLKTSLGPIDSSGSGGPPR